MDATHYRLGLSVHLCFTPTFMLTLCLSRSLSPPFHRLIGHLTHPSVCEPTLYTHAYRAFGEANLCEDGFQAASFQDGGR